MMNLYLVRHGDRFMTPPDPELTELGISQAQKTGRFLKQFPITKIIASPLTRAFQTAEHINSHLQLPIEKDERLRERMNFGDVPEQTIEEFWAEWSRSSWERTYAPHIGRSSVENGKNLEMMLREQTGHEHILFVSHGGTIADFLRNVIGEETMQVVLNDFPDGKDFDIKNCSVSQVCLENDCFTLKLLNHVDHLKDES